MAALKFLLSNDDGFSAPGLIAMAEVLQEFGDIMVAAPDRERSAVGHGITVHHPLRIRQKPLLPDLEDSYMVSGTPADCVKLAIQGLGWKPDIVFSGINRGANLGTDVLYAGTVSAALEALLLGYPAAAISLCGQDILHYDTAKNALRAILEENILPWHELGLYNINVPGQPWEQIKGFRFTQQGTRIYQNVFEQRQDPRGIPYFWLGGSPAASERDPKIDVTTVSDGYVSITPLQADLTDRRLLDRLNGEPVDSQ